VSDGPTVWFEYWRAGGPLMLPLAACCFLIWAYVIRSRMAVRRLLRDAERVHSGDCTDGVVGALMARCRGRGADAVGAFEQGAVQISNAMKRDMLVLAALTAAAPLLGLLGTVNGMSETFRGAGELSHATTGRVAGGISTALVTTQFGLVIAIPGLFGMAGVRRLSGRLQAALGGCRSVLLRASVSLAHDGGGAS
jgi:biopolymer transport protein ExbB